ncbi:hypothetical protein C8R45DRAFT_934688 [Mycena sanguinolenta]|nr:hypothetical protein C8R45DRAFT_934688 [Mycena sanguinolenta]
MGNIILLVTAIALFTLVTVQTVITLILGTGEIEDFDIPYRQLGDATDVIYTINKYVQILSIAAIFMEPSSFIADGLVIYRCYVVWNNNVLVTILPLLMLIAGTILGLVEIFDFSLSLYPFFAISLATNVLVTMLTAGRIWWISHYSRAYLQVAERRRYTSAGAILIESGMLYSATILAYLILLSTPSAAIEPIFEMQVQIMRQSAAIDCAAHVELGRGGSTGGSIGKVRTCSGKPVPLQRQFHVNSGNIPLFCGKQHLQAVHAFSVAIYASIVGRHNNCQGEAVTNLTTVEALELPQSTPLRPHLLPLRTQHWLRCSSSPSSPVEDIFLRHFHQRQPTPSYC